MHSYQVGWEIRIVAWDLTYFSSLCVLEVKILVRLFICGVSEPSQLVYTCNKYQNLRCWLICYFQICVLKAWLCIGLDSKTNLSIKMLIISYLIVLTFVYGAQKNRLIETLLLSTRNICFSWKIRNLIFNFTLLSGGLALSKLTCMLVLPNSHKLTLCLSAVNFVICCWSLQTVLDPD